MVRVHVICEGQTEERFIKELLAPHFALMDIFLSPSLLGKPGHKGGNVKFDRLFTDVRNRLRGDPTAYCTTFFDFYGLSSDFPGKEAASARITIREKADAVCSSLVSAIQTKLNDISLHHFIPYVQMCEFEALLFSNTEGFAKSIDHPELAEKLHRIRDSFDSPEEINDSPTTAPSKRVLELVAGYEKPLHGSLAALEIGLELMRRECTLFDEWLQKLEALKSKPN